MEPETPSAAPGPSSRQQSARRQEQSAEAAGRSNGALTVAATQLNQFEVPSEPV